MDSAQLLTLHAVTKSFARGAIPAVNSISLTLNSGTVLGLLGPSGCGKTTLLRLIAGFEKPTSGEICIRGRAVSTPTAYRPPEQRGIGMVFQDFALFPHLTVAENIMFGLKPLRRQTAQQKKARIRDVLELVRLRDLDHRYPHELSGGQQQRVSLARALAPAPNLVLLDEPLSNLDVQVRLQLREELRLILKESGTTAIFVTHDQEEALSLADQIAVMRQGQIEQLGTPELIYLNPATPFVAEFVAQVNFVPAICQSSTGQAQWQTELGTFHLAADGLDAAIAHGAEETVLMIREEDLQIQADPQGTVVIRDRQFLGREYRYCLRTASGREFHARAAGLEPWPVGTTVKLDCRSQSLKIFQRAAYRDG